MQTVRVAGACLVGTGAELVTVEARFEGTRRERTEVVLTGLPDPVIRESRGKLLSALTANGLHIPTGRLYLNLVPAARRKSGEILDLPLVLGAAAACGHLTPGALRDVLFLGEVGIDGRLHGVPGGLAAADCGRERGLRVVIAPPATASEAACLPEIEAFGARHLGQVVAHLLGGERLPRVSPPETPPVSGADDVSRLDLVRGQRGGKRALVVAAAGSHGLLMVGPPGAGKSMLARNLPALMPTPELEERLDITRALSAAGRWPGGLAIARPFRSPHHTASYAGMVGGGSPPTAGEITLAHRGVLFLDELAEFRRDVLEALRQPLETGTISIARANRRFEFPARFLLVAAMNPCPCGYLGHARIPCRCAPYHVDRYRRRLSGPLLDRIDLRIELQPLPCEELLASKPAAGLPGSGPRGVDLRAQVSRAAERARERQERRANADLPAESLDRYAPLDAESRTLLARAASGRALSARAIQSVRRVARTLADLADADAPTTDHVAEALALRAPLLDLATQH